MKKMNNIFENAYFGKPYMTRDGRKAILLQKTFDYDGITQRGFIVATNDWQSVYSSYPIDLEGKMQCWSHQRPEDIFVGGDIVSEWKEPIDEEKTIDKACEWLEKELKKLSMKEIKEDFLSNEFKVILETDIPKWIDDFRKFMDGKQ